MFLFDLQTVAFLVLKNARCIAGIAPPKEKNSCLTSTNPNTSRYGEPHSRVEDYEFKVSRTLTISGAPSSNSMSRLGMASTAFGTFYLKVHLFEIGEA